MKGIGIQFDNLTGVLQKNINDKQLIQSKDNFDLVYEKVTQETLKTISVVIDSLSDDISLKLSFSTLLKQLKTFLSLKPVNQDDQEEEYFKQEFDEVQQFMNSRKPVMNDVDTGQRGDIYKFLFQAENKEKDMQEFMGNMNKCNPQGNKKFQSTKYKWKKTLKTIHILTEDITVQTDLSMQVFEKLENKFPSLFKPSFSTNAQEIENQLLQEFDIEAKIQQIVKQRIQQKAKAIEQQVAKQENEAKQKEAKKKEAEIKKKKPNQTKRNTQTNLKRVSNVGVSFKAKSQLASKKQSISLESKQNIESLPPISELTTKTSTKQNTCLLPQSAVQDLNANSQINQKEQNQIINKADKLLPSYESMSQILSGLKGLEGVSSEQMKKIYQALRSQFAENIGRNPQAFHALSNCENCSASQNQLINQKRIIWNNKETEQKQVNTVLSYLDGTSHHEINNFGIIDSKQNIHKFINKCHPSYSLQVENQGTAWNQGNNQPNFSLHQSIHRSHDTKKDKTENLEFNSSNNQAGKTYEVSKQSEIKVEINNPKSGLPQIFKGQKDTVNIIQGSDSRDSLVKEGKSSQEYMKKLKDSKHLKSLQNNKSINKQNYSLDMYKSKDFLPKNKTSQHVNFPSINRTTQNRAHMSLHDEVNETNKNPYLKKLSKNTFHHSTTNDQALFIDKESPIHELGRKKTKKDRMNDISSEEEKIMKELERMSGENSIKLNMKSIAMYIKYVQSIHLKKCGQKCVHLERFYEFLHRNNLPNRKQLQLHKADMNSNFNL